MERKSYELQHPLADRMSVVRGAHVYSGENTAEIAFFLRGEWVTTVVDPALEQYAEGEPNTMDTRIYAYVPVQEIASFLHYYATTKPSNYGL